MLQKTDQVPSDKCELVTEITLDLSPPMRDICLMKFPNAKRVIDRFYAQKLALEAIQEMRIGHRWKALKDDHKRELGSRRPAKLSHRNC